MAQILIKRGSRANLDTAAGASGLTQGEPYLVTDEDRLAVGTAAGTYAEALKRGTDSTDRLFLSVHSAGNTGAAFEVPWDNHQRITATLNDNAALTFATPPAAMHGRLHLVASGSFTPTLPSGLRVVGTLPESLALTNTQILRIDAEYDGSSWFIGVSKITETTA